MSTNSDKQMIYGTDGPRDILTGYQFTSYPIPRYKCPSNSCQIIHQIFLWACSFSFAVSLCPSITPVSNTLCGFDLSPCRPCEGNRLLRMFGSSCRLYVRSSMTIWSRQPIILDPLGYLMTSQQVQMPPHHCSAPPNWRGGRCHF